MTSLRINSNTPALNSHRQLLKTDLNVTRSFERASSGLKINRAADNPSSLVISEKLRNYIASTTQAMDNNQQAISMVQTAEAAMDESNKLLIRMKQLALHASNEGANDPDMLEADQAEFDAAVSQLNRIAKFTSFGSQRKKLLNGEHANMGISMGRGLTLIDANEDTSSTPFGGYRVVVSQNATKAFTIGENELEQDIIDEGENIKIYSDGKVLDMVTEFGDSSLGVVQKLNNLAEAKDMNVKVTLTDNNKIMVQHTEFGSDKSFGVSSSSQGILSDDPNIILQVNNGRDVQGTINDEVANGKGEYLYGKQYSANDGLVIRYQHDGEDFEEDLVDVGSVFHKQNALRYQIGPDYAQTESVEFMSVYANDLGRNVDNDSGFRALDEIDLRSFQGAQSAIKLLNKASADVSLARGRLGAVQRHALESNSRYLQSHRENMVFAESAIRDTDMAEEISFLTREQVKRQASTAILAQANQNPQNVLSLLQ